MNLSSWSLLSRLLLILLKLGLINRTLNNICDRHNGGDRVIRQILLLRLTLHSTHFLIFVLGIISGNTFFDQTSLSDPFFNTHAHGHHLCEAAGYTCKYMLIIGLSKVSRKISVNSFSSKGRLTCAATSLDRWA